MAKTYIQRGDILTLPAPAAVASGGVVVAGAIVGVAMGSAASGAAVDVATVGVFRLPKISAQTHTLGEIVFWDAGDALVSDDAESGANPRIGVVVEAAGNGVGTVAVRLG